ncbi:MAG: diaminopimelate decarboxylase [Candidatus Altiarchaeota archaeon]|nr:diaminopimelate decarboxylase [Candidatus Altiarchaeota archaeon]
MEAKNNKLFLGGVSAEDLVAKYESPLYVYEEEVIRERYNNLYSSIDYPKKKILYACKANSNLAILKMLKELGCGIDAVSPGEIHLALKLGFKPEDIVFTGNNTRNDEMEFAVKNRVLVNIDSLNQLERYGRLFPGTKVSVRINPDVGAGYHKHIITGGPDSKFGIYFDKVGEAQKIAREHNLRIVGVHSHIGSGILDVDIYLQAMKITMDVAKEFKNIDFMDFGGGIGIPYKPGEKEIDMKKFGKDVSDLFTRFCDDYGRQLTIMFEPGRYLVGQSGFLLTVVNTIKETPKHKFIGTDTGFNQLIRPSIYGSYHEIINASNVSGKKERVIVAGNVCESGDVMTRDREDPVDRDIPEARVGDVLAICNAGAYGFSMASEYNSRPRPAEVLTKGGKSRLVRERGGFDDLLRGQIS